MNDTRITLLQQIASGNSVAWNEAEELYRPLIAKWLRMQGLPPGETDDLTQEVMLVLVRRAEDFEHNGRVGAFRAWLRQTTANVARNYVRQRKLPQADGSSQFQQVLDQLAVDTSEVSRVFDVEHDRMIIQRLLNTISEQIKPVNLEIFKRNVLDEVSAQDVAKELGVSVASVHTAKSRIMRRLRETAADLIDELRF